MDSTLAKIHSADASMRSGWGADNVLIKELQGWARQVIKVKILEKGFCWWSKLHSSGGPHATKMQQISLNRLWAVALHFPSNSIHALGLNSQLANGWILIYAGNQSNSDQSQQLKGIWAGMNSVNCWAEQQDLCALTHHPWGLMHLEFMSSGCKEQGMSSPRPSALVLSTCPFG